MINTDYLYFNVLTKPEKDLFKKVQSNAKFKTIDDVLKTRVGINNFYTFNIAVKSTIIVRDIILNSQFVSGWARSSQVLNDNDSKFSVYKFLTKTNEQQSEWISLMEKLENDGHSMDNMRSLIYLDSINDYAFSIDMLHLLYLTLIMDDMSNNVSDNNLREELSFFKDKFANLLVEYDVDYNKFKNMLQYAVQDFPVTNASIKANIEQNVMEHTYDVNAVYSVVGQLYRHRTLVKTYSHNNYDDELIASKMQTEKYDYSLIGMNDTIANYIKRFTDRAASIYDLCQGSIVPIKITGTTGALYRALCQRTCYINDSPQFKDVFRDFENDHKENGLTLMPPCKFNGNACYVGYVNESRRAGEEKTQIPCPIYCKAKKYEEDFKKACNTNKTQWYIKNLKNWGNVCK